MNNLRKIIREVIMSEAYEHSDEEIVTFDNIDLKYEFDKLNKLLFDGSIEMVPISWSTTKGRHGHVSYNTNRDRTVARIIGLFMSKFFRIPYKKFKDTLAHEMIHVKNLQDDIRSNKRHYKEYAHGSDFLREMSRINNLGLGFKISVKGEESYDVSDQIKGKNVYFAILKTNDINAIIVMNQKAFSDRKETLESLYNKLIRAGKYKNIEFEYYKSNSPQLLKYPVQRSFARSVSYVKLTDEQTQKIKEASEFIEKVNLGKDTVDQLNTTDKESRENSGFFTNQNTLTKVDPPSIKNNPEDEKKYDNTEDIKSKSEVDDQIKDQNKQIMSLFKGSNDNMQKEELFKILKVTNKDLRKTMIDKYNMRFGRLGFIMI